MANNPLIRVCKNCGQTHHVLTERQLEIIKGLIAKPDASYDDLAKQMTISPHTVRHHLSAIYKRLGVSGRLSCVTTCLALGIIALEEVRQVRH